MAPIPLSSSSLLSRSSSVLAPISNLLASRTPLSSEPSAAVQPSIRDASPISSRLLHFIHKRQNDPSVIPTTYGSINSGPSPGTVVGIVLGSVGGFLLILWLIYTCLNFGQWGGSDYTESVVVRNKRKSHHGSTRSRRVSETVEVRRAPSRSPVRIVRTPVPPERVERVVVEERRETRRERSRGGSDEVVVIEEHSPPRRSKSKRESRESRESRDSGGYRTVDPLAYGGVVGGRRK